LVRASVLVDCMFSAVNCSCCSLIRNLLLFTHVPYAFDRILDEVISISGALNVYVGLQVLTAASVKVGCPVVCSAIRLLEVYQQSSL
jgi:hypothetical protein